MRIKTYIILLSVSLLTWSCNTDPVFPLEPEISFISITPDSATAFADEITVTIHYQDGDGDLGYSTDSGDVPTKNFFVRDLRPTIPDSVRLTELSFPSLTPSTKNPSIQGTIQVKLICPPHASFFPPGCTDCDDVTFEIYIVDRAGNVSNKVVTTPVTILL